LKLACGAHTAGCYSNLFPLSESRGEKRAFDIFMRERAVDVNMKFVCAAASATPTRAAMHTHGEHSAASLALTTSGSGLLPILFVCNEGAAAIYSIHIIK
jgi:hypothetical protein